jgi:lipopolysaccharide transport system ATP-binding protein
MSDVIIRAEGLGKSYRISHNAPREGYVALRDVLSRQGRVLWDAARGARRQESLAKFEEFWALRDVAFEIKRGEAVGIIGHNGAGKSTLLKILSRITEPTRGRVTLRGRTASLLEVGTGFHPELTGRENIFLNGAILGMARAEIKRKFDEIVAFAEIEKFLDTPVKRYSSGMYVRLAFSIAAHIDPEILIVDEVLAVGDLDFQKRCLGKMATFATGGRTVLFVSHNVVAIRRLCSRCMMLKAGVVEADGSPGSTVSQYLTSDASSTGEISWRDGKANPGELQFCFLRACLLDERLQPAATFYDNETLRVELSYRVTRPLGNSRVGFLVSTSDGVAVFETYDTDRLPEFQSRPAGVSTVTCELPLSALMPGRYIVSLNAGIPDVRNLAYVEGALRFDLHASSARHFDVHVSRAGAMNPHANWSTRCDA